MEFTIYIDICAVPKIGIKISEKAFSKVEPSSFAGKYSVYVSREGGFVINGRGGFCSLWMVSIYLRACGLTRFDVDSDHCHYSDQIVQQTNRHMLQNIGL